MNARELHDELQRIGIGKLLALDDGDETTILSALSLLAAAEANDGKTPLTDAETALCDMGHLKVRTSFARTLERRCSGLAAEVVRLKEALRELLETTLSEMPPHEAGKDAQDAWADRRAKARNDAAAIDAERAGKPDLAPLMHQDPDACAEYWRKP